MKDGTMSGAPLALRTEAPESDEFDCFTQSLAC
jgi:hypothetical protein